MDTTQEFAVTQMRKSVENLGSSTQSYGDATMMRFLIARSMDPQKAANMFVQWLKWRSDFVPNGCIPESEVEDQLDTRKVFLQCSSNGGYPLVIVQANKHYPAKDALQFKKFVVHFLDKTLASSTKGREMGNEKLIGVLDLQKISYRNVDARGLITGFQFLQAYYPERLAKLFILHMPRFFVSVWKLVSRFLEKATLDKIVIVTNEEETRDFIEEIGEESVPEEYGGQAKLVAIQDVVIPQLDR
ncbi:Sec14p-like phosphatidylinositol transfer family protein [Euphorbia peplus]|nr:Sec14p-like phosphatidylinositol transfer family protein [Euphorbia peplus]